VCSRRRDVDWARERDRVLERFKNGTGADEPNSFIPPKCVYLAYNHNRLLNRGDFIDSSSLSENSLASESIKRTSTCSPWWCGARNARVRQRAADSRAERYIGWKKEDSHSASGESDNFGTREREKEQSFLQEIYSRARVVCGSRAA
jgi:hypothetical protein